MEFDLLKRIYWRLLVNLSSDAYEQSRASSSGIAFPDCFNSTRSLFIHIPKTGGVSVATGLYGTLIPHYTWQEWRRVNPQKFRRYFKFAVVRDPVARFASSFDFLKGGGINSADREFAQTELSPFGSANELANALTDPALRIRILSQCHFTPQSEFVAARSGQLKVNRLIRFDDLRAGFADIAGILGLVGIQLPHLNKTPERQEACFDSHGRSALERIYRQDFILWRESAS